jgi:exodeoxyribonuclease VII large subunit
MLADMDSIELGVSEFVALLNQTLDFAYPSIIITGELANLRVSKGKWLYFDLKDDSSTIKCFGTIYQLPGPLEDGMLLKVRGQPRLHNLYGFSFNVQNIQPAGEGSIKKAAALLEAKLSAEGLFDEARKRTLPYPPQRIGLVASKQSAAYADFVKVLQARWGGLAIELIDVQVQGEVAPGQIVAAIEQFNALAQPPEALILIRGGGSAEDLAAFSTEQVTRAVAASRVPTLVAIGHEIDLSLAELAADQRASTPSNAAELLVPDRKHELLVLRDKTQLLGTQLSQTVTLARNTLAQTAQELQRFTHQIFEQQQHALQLKTQLLAVFDPRAVLKRGYAIVRQEARLITSVKSFKMNQNITLELQDGSIGAQVTQLNPKKS